MKKHFSFFFSILFVLLSSFSLSANAAEIPLVDGVSNSCPLYNVQGVKVSLSTQATKSSLGSEIPFVASLTNDNNFAVVDGSLLIRIVRIDGSISDEFFVDKGAIVIDAKSSYKTNFSWRVPAFAFPGEYTAKAYFISGDTFNLGGVTFVDGLSAGGTSFSLAGDNKQFITYDIDSLRVNGVITGASAEASVKSSDKISISLPLRHNLTAKTDTVVTWRVYKWDSITDANLISSSVEKLTLLPGVTSRLDFSFTDKNSSSYRVVAEIKWMDSKSIFMKRIVRSGVSDSELRIVALTSPSTSAPAKVFGCIDNTVVSGDDGLFPKTLRLRAVDGGTEVINTSFEIPRTRVVGFVSPLALGASYSALNITADLISKDGVTLSSATVGYDCEKINPSLCSSTSSALGKNIPYIEIAIFVAVIIVGVVLIKLRRKSVKNISPLQ